MSEGFVVASVGAYFLMASKSPLGVRRRGGGGGASVANDDGVLPELIELGHVDDKNNRY
jgi:hypothetical protein